MNVYLKLICMIFLYFLTGCASREDALDFFVATREFQVGSRIEEIPLGDPLSIVNADENTEVYTYGFFNKNKRLLSLEIQYR